jgi:hypothetical protein
MQHGHLLQELLLCSLLLWQRQLLPLLVMCCLAQILTSQSANMGVQGMHQDQCINVQGKFHAVAARDCVVADCKPCSLHTVSDCCGSSN